MIQKDDVKWFMHNNKPTEGTVESVLQNIIDGELISTTYRLSLGLLKGNVLKVEADLFDTKQLLLNSL